jgi:MFS family permease
MGNKHDAAPADAEEVEAGRHEHDEPLHQPRTSHFLSALALCSSVLTMFFVLMTIFPYSGYMALFLLSKNETDDAGPPTLTRETVGLYAGVLSSSFMIGRAVTGFPWGQLADVYGRKFVLVVALLSSVVGSVAFGCAPSYGTAVLIRLVMGASSMAMMPLFVGVGFVVLSGLLVVGGSSVVLADVMLALWSLWLSTLSYARCRT